MIPQRLSAGIENPPGKMRDRAHGRRQRIVEYEQIVVGIERQLVGKERAFGLAGRGEPLVDFFGEESGNRKERGDGEARAAQDGATQKAERIATGEAVHGSALQDRCRQMGTS